MPPATPRKGAKASKPAAKRAAKADSPKGSAKGAQAKPKAAAKAAAGGPRKGSTSAADAPAKARPASTISSAASPRRSSPRRIIVPDTSVIVDGRIASLMQRGDLKDARILIAAAVGAELEHQANIGRETGFNGLDEIVKIQDLKDVAECEVEFVGTRPSTEQILHAESGEIDAMIRAVAHEAGGTLYTSDRVQAHVARAMGIPVEWVRPITEREEVEQDLAELEIMKYFDEDTMSVHLKYDIPPEAKKGKPGSVRLEVLDRRPMDLRAMTRMRSEIIEAAKRDAGSFVEIERTGATVVQLGPMRIAIAQPPFSDAIEITAVRPVAKLTLDEYDLKHELRERIASYTRGVFVSGPPGSGKSTFVTAAAEWLRGHGTIVKTMESPRDLQVMDAITQYAPLDGDMALTSDVLLLVRPDFVVYDEVRKTEDFEIFGDMRLAGVGLLGVTHANRAIDAVQRLIGRVELGMIPQVVDTVIHIEGGKIQQVLDLSFTVKTPAGMTEADLARPVIEVRDFEKGRVEYEIYTYGEQVVVMPVASIGGGAAKSGRDVLAARELRRVARAWVDGPFDVEITGDNSAVVYVEQKLIGRLVGKGGATVRQLEDEVGLKLDIRPYETLRKKRRGERDADRSRAPRRPPAEARLPAPEEDFEADLEELETAEDYAFENGGARSRRYSELRPEVRKSKKNIVLLLPRDLAGQDVTVLVDDEPLFEGTLGSKGDLRVSRRSEEGELLADALAAGGVVTCRV